MYSIVVEHNTTQEADPMLIYRICLFHDFGEPSFETIEVHVRNSSEAIQAGRDLKTRRGVRSDFFTVQNDMGQEVYHSIFGRWDDPRLP